MKKHILLLSAYDAMSHRQWRQSLASLFPEFTWTQLSLPPRHFSWRVRGNSLLWGQGEHVELEQSYDLLIATSLVDLASLRGFRPALARIPSVVYFHENQFAYPRSPEQVQRPYDTDLDAALVSLYSALCADRVVFNSDYNRLSFLAGARQLFNRLPDRLPTRVIEKLSLAETLPVPLDPALTGRRSASMTEPQQVAPAVLTVAWNHRWEYDKGPALLLTLVKAVVDQELPIRFCIMGQQFRRQPEEFEQLGRLLAAHDRRNPQWPSHLGYVPDRSDYLGRLASCDVVLSTAIHDFQGLAVLEACALGCTPLCPDQLVYPEYLDQRFLYPAPAGGKDDVTLQALLTSLCAWQQQLASGRPLPAFQPTAFAAATLKKRYLALFEALWQ
jgi:glycosyltransferase involved in cell wall biosynthesis